MGDDPDAGRTGRQFVAASAGCVGGGPLAGFLGRYSRFADGGATAVRTETDPRPRRRGGRPRNAPDPRDARGRPRRRSGHRGRRGLRPRPGARHQDPLIDLLQFGTGAGRCYPDQFDEWPTCVEGSHPEIPAAERLFDHDRVTTVLSDKP